MPIRNVTGRPICGGYHRADEESETTDSRRWFGRLPWLDTVTRWIVAPESRAAALTIRIVGLAVYTVLLIGGSALLTGRIAAAVDAHPATDQQPQAGASHVRTVIATMAPASATPPPSTTTAPPPPPSSSTPAPPPPAKPDPPSGESSKAEIAVEFALNQLGVPYVWGGAGPNGYDCSGLTMRAYAAAGIKLPHRAALQAHAGVRVKTAQRGDLVISNGGHHVSLALGDGRVVEAPTPGQRVSIHSMPKHITAIVRVT